MSNANDLKDIIPDLIYARDNYTCRYCGRQLNVCFDLYCQITLDHIEPKSKAGQPASYEGFATACAVCNQAKGDFYPSRVQSTQDAIEKIKRYIQYKLAWQKAYFENRAKSPFQPNTELLENPHWWGDALDNACEDLKRNLQTMLGSDYKIEHYRFRPKTTSTRWIELVKLLGEGREEVWWYAGIEKSGGVILQFWLAHEYTQRLASKLLIPVEELVLQPDEKTLFKIALHGFSPHKHWCCPGPFVVLSENGCNEESLVYASKWLCSQIRVSESTAGTLSHRLRDLQS